LYIRIG